MERDIYIKEKIKKLEKFGVSVLEYSGGFWLQHNSNCQIFEGKTFEEACAKLHAYIKGLIEYRKSLHFNPELLNP